MNKLVIIGLDGGTDTVLKPAGRELPCSTTTPNRRRIRDAVVDGATGDGGGVALFGDRTASGTSRHF